MYDSFLVPVIKEEKRRKEIRQVRRQRAEMLKRRTNMHM